MKVVGQFEMAGDGGESRRVAVCGILGVCLNGQAGTKTRLPRMSSPESRRKARIRQLSVLADSGDSRVVAPEQPGSPNLGGDSIDAP